METGKTNTIKFLSMNIIHEYNMTTWSVDLADQLQGNYHIGIRVHNRKWWYLLMFWYIGVMIQNS